MRRCLSVVGLLVLLASVAAAQTVGTAFTYQGRLTDGGTPADGAYDFQFILYSAATGGSQVGAIALRDDVVVTNGLFTVTLDFGPTAFTGSARWLDIGVRPGTSTGAYTPLVGRQELTPSPNALFAQSATWSGVSAKPPGFADDTDNDSLGGLSCPAGQIARWSGTAWGCAPDADTGVDAVIAGSGITGSIAGRTLTVGTDSTVQRRMVVPACPGGLYLRSIAADGTPTCATDSNSGGTVTSVGSGNGLLGGPVTTAGTLSVNFGGTGLSTQAARSDHDHFGQIWQSGADHLYGLSVNNLAFNLLNPVGIHGRTGGTGFNAAGVLGVASASANTGGARGVVGYTSSPTSSGAGVYGEASHSAAMGAGVWGSASSSNAYAGYFSGRVRVTGNLSKGAGSFLIDHPLDPENKYLYHSFVESPDMMNVYNGNVVLGPDGEAEVVLLEWFEALNKEFRYQLTALGGPGPGLHVVEEVAGNRFRIGGGSAGLKVSWQVTGIRKDPYAEKHRVPVEEEKPVHERGVYLHPEAYGVPAERGLEHRRGGSVSAASSGIAAVAAAPNRDH